MRAAAVLTLLLALALPPAHAQTPPPYENDLMRLADILGALHYLRTLCGDEDAPVWRERMQALIEGESCEADRCERLAGAFNEGYRGFERNYRICTPAARVAAERYLTEGARLADGITSRHAN